MNKRSRKHHYIPELFLAGFSNPQNRGMLWVTDILEEKQFESLPRNTGYESDFHTIDSPTGDDDVFERIIERAIEGPAVAAIKAVRRSGRLPSGKDYIYLMNYLALLAVRIPGFRNTVNKMHRDTIEFCLLNIVRDKETFEQLQAEVIADSDEPIETFSYEEAKEFFDGGIEIDIKNIAHLRLLGEMCDNISPMLQARNWSFFESASAQANFVCTDRPVGINSTVPYLPIYGPGGFATATTVIQVPISRTKCMIGRWEMIRPRVTCDKAQVARINWHSIKHTHRFIYSSEKNFLMHGPGGQVLEGLEAVKGLKRFRQSNNAPTESDPV